MKVEGGGAYYIISRILGIEFGSAIGILLCLSQHAAIALCVSGFSISLQQFYPQISLVVIKATTLCSLILISYLSTEFAIKTQVLIFLTILVSMTSIFLGSGATLVESLPLQDLPLTPLTFWMAFAMFFPAATGIEAGMSMSGDLLRPNRSLPLGTIASVLVAYLLYSTLAFFLSKEVAAPLLISYPFILYHLAKVKVLVIVGMWGATLSSALGNMLGAPRVIQALAKDHVLPSVLSKGHGKANLPRIATLLVLAVSLIFTFSADINQIIPMMTMICLSSYGLINFVAFFETFIKNPSWRPNFQIPWIFPLIASLGCFAVMFLINPGASLLVVVLATGLCIWTSYRELHSGFDDIRYSLFSFLVHKGAAKLSQLQPNAKSWRPYILTLFWPTGLPQNLAFFSHALDHGKGFLTFGGNLEKEIDQEPIKQTLDQLKIPSFLHINYSKNTPSNLIQQIKNYGFGPLRPNTIILPLENNVESICQVLKDIKHIKKNILVFKSDPNNRRLYSENSSTSKQINLWWKGGNQNNFELCLALSYSLRGSPMWSGAKICIKSILEDEVSMRQLTSIFKRYEKKLRIKNLFFSPILHPSGDFFTILEEQSKDADFTFLGLMPQNGEKPDAEYQQYIKSFFKNTEPISNLAYILAGEDLSFEKIFK